MVVVSGDLLRIGGAQDGAFHGRGELVKEGVGEGDRFSVEGELWWLEGLACCGHFGGRRENHGVAGDGSKEAEPIAEEGAKSKSGDRGVGAPRVTPCRP